MRDSDTRDVKAVGKKDSLGWVNTSSCAVQGVSSKQEGGDCGRESWAGAGQLKDGRA